MSSISIPNVVITINQSTSRTFYEPSYVVPLLRALWSGAVDDVYKDIVVTEPKNPHQRANSQRTLDGTFEEVLSYEEQRLRRLYGVNPRTNALLFDIVYPGNTFRAAFGAVVEGEPGFAGDGKKDSAGPHTVFVNIGIPDNDASRLVAAGITSVEQLAHCSVGDLLPVPGIGRAKGQRYIDLASEAVFSPTEGAAAEAPEAATSLSEDD